MTNPINPANRTATNSVNSNTAKAQNKEPVASSPAASSPASKDTVSLSSQSQQVIELQQHLKTHRVSIAPGSMPSSRKSPLAITR